MCGFLDWFDLSGSGQAPPRVDLEAGLARIAHRGPDDSAVAEGDGYWMGFRRLAILDLSLNGRQPMLFGGGRFTLTFNGEIYNYRELRSRYLEDDLRSSGDSEVLGRLLLKLGVEETLHALRGMFAFVWWDRKDRVAIAARDQFGIKPLIYWISPNGSQIVIGSELKALLAIAEVSRKTNTEALADYFEWGSMQAPASIVEGVSSLRPGEWMRCVGHERVVRSYFEAFWPAPDARLERGEAARERVRDGVLESVRAHLISDVPVGVFLSGGLDSSIVAAAYRSVSSGELKSYSIGFEGPVGIEDETSVAEQTAKYLGATHSKEVISGPLLESIFDGYIAVLDQPTGDALNSYLVSRLAARDVKVALSGLGADEWFGGYNYHRLALLGNRLGLPTAVLRRIVRRGFNRFAGLLGNADEHCPAMKALAAICGARGNTANEIYRFGRTLMPLANREALLTTAVSHDLARDAIDESQQCWMHGLFARETRGYLANTLLRDNDIVSMAHSLELRVPFVDRVVHEWCRTIHPSQLIGFRHGKVILREAMRDLLPAWILDDRKKKTFTLPLMKWLREPVWRDRLYDTLLSKQCRERGWLVQGELHRLLDRFYESAEITRRGWLVSQRVWLCFVLESWAHVHLDR